MHFDQQVLCGIDAIVAQQKAAAFARWSREAREDLIRSQGLMDREDSIKCAYRAQDWAHLARLNLFALIDARSRK